MLDPSPSLTRRPTRRRLPAGSARRTLLATTLLALALPSWAAAQGVQYTQRSRTEMGGAMGAMMSAMGQGGGDTESRVRILGSRIRTDDGAESTLVDLEAGTLVMLDHDARTVVRTTFEELAAEMARVRAEVEAQTGQDLDAAGVGAPEAEVTTTDERETIEGYEARRTILTLETSFRLPTGMEGMEGMPGMPGAGGSEMTTIMVNDLWLSSELPGVELSEELAREWSETMSSAMGGLLPGGGNSMAALAAGGELAGVPLRSVTSTVFLPQGTDFDLQAVLDGADEPLGGGGGGLGAMARAMMGGGGGGAEGQTVFMRVVTETTEVQEGGVDESAFQVPADYRETTLRESMRRE